MRRARSADTARHAAPPARVAGPTLWARVASRLTAYAAQRGADRASLLAAAGLAEHDLRDPDARVPLDAAYALAERAADALGDPAFGLRFALALRVEDLDALGFLIVTSPTFGGALERTIRYQRVWNDGERYALLDDGATLRVTYAPHGAPRAAHRLFAEMAMADLVINGGRLVPEARPLSVRFAHARPAYAPECERLFAVAVAYDAPVTEAVFPRGAAALPMPHANAALCAMLERYADGMVARLPAAGTLAARVRARIAQELAGAGPPDVRTLAAALRMSARTLQRRLRDEGASAHALLDEVRREQAAALLRAGASIHELAWVLGYSDPSAFHRAFKRWTGRSPEAFRAEQAAGRT